MPELELFSKWLAQHRRGELDAEITAALADVVQQTQSVGDPAKKGEVTIKIKVAAAYRDAPTVTVLDEVGVKRPEFGRPSSTYYLDVTGGLTRHDPAQLSLAAGEGGEAR